MPFVWEQKGVIAAVADQDRDDFTPFAHVLSHSGMVMRACGHGLGAKDRSR